MTRIIWLLTLILLPFSAVAQESDKDFLTRFLEENLSSAGRAVTITGFAGALSSQATMAQMTIADDTGVWLTVKDVTLDWSQSAILTGKIVINEFTAGEIELSRMPQTDPATPSAEAKGFSLPDLPVSIDIKNVAARHIILGSTVLGQAVEGAMTASAQLAGGQGQAQISLKRTDAGPAGEFGLTASYAKDTGALTVDLTAKEAAGGVAVGLLGVPGAPAAELSVKGTGPISDFVADVALRTDGVTRLGGKVTLFQAEGNTGFEADLSGDPTPIFLPQYAAFFGPDVALQAKGQRYADGRMELSTLHVAAQALTLNGLLNLDATGAPSSFSLTGHVGLADGSVVLPLTTERETRLFAADLTLNYSRLAGDIWQGKATVEGLDHAAFKASHAELSGSGHITNTEGAAFDGRIDFVTKGLAAVDPALAKAIGTALNGQVVLNWKSGQDVKVSNLSLAGEGFAVATTGTIGGFADGFALTGTAQGNYDDLSRLADLTGRPLAGTVAFDLKGTGSPLSGVVDVDGTMRGKNLSVGMVQVDGLLTGDTQIALSIKRDTAGTLIRKLELAATGLSAQVDGLIATEGVNLKGSFNLADAGVLGAGYSGALRGDATIGGPLATALLTLDADGTDLKLGQPQLDGLLAGQSHVVLNLRRNVDGAEVQKADVTFAKGSISASGQVGPASNDLTAQLALTDLATLNFGLSGGFTGDLHFTGMPTDGKLTVDAQAQGLALGQTLADTLLRGASHLVAELDLTPEGVGVTNLSLNNGQVQLKATGTVNGTQRQLQVDSRILNLGLLYPQFPGALIAKGSATQDANGYTFDLSVTGPAQIDARVRGTMANTIRSADLAITGTAAAGLANKLLEPRAISGLVRYDLRLNGPIALNSISGAVNLTNGQLADPGQNFGLRGLTATAQLSGGQARISGSTKVSSGGTLDITGTVGLRPPLQADLAVKLNTVGLRNPALYSTKVEGAVTIKGPLLAGALISGSLTLGRTELQIPSTGFGADATMTDLQHQREPGDSLETRRRAGQLDEKVGTRGAANGFALNLRIAAPNQVFIRGRGLDAELGGALTLRGTTNAIIPAGAFNLIRGRLDILGRRLALSEALLQLQGALVPYVRILASVESEGITASVLIQGDATNPVVTFTSSPELPQEEVIARLLFDRGLDTLTAFQAIQLASAVATLAGKGGDGIVGSIRKKAGLDNLDVTTDATGAAAVTLGKYLTEKVYTEVEVKQGNSTISLNLDVAPHVTLKTHLDSDGQTGLGIFLQRDY